MPMAKIPVPALPDKPAKGPPRLKRWTFAGLLVTYWCNARCAFCYVYSGPNKKSGPKLSVEQALGFLARAEPAGGRGRGELREVRGARVQGPLCGGGAVL